MIRASFSTHRRRVVHVAAAVVRVVLTAVALLGFFPDSTRAGDTDTRHFLRATYQLGWVLQSNDFVRGFNTTGAPIRYVHAGRLDVGWQTAGSQDWHHLYDFPAYGLGLYTGSFSNRGAVGALTAINGFFTWPVHRTSRLTVSAEFRLGLAEDFALFSPVDNPFQDPIAAGLSIYVDLGGHASYRMSPRFDLLGGLTIAHFSNGGTVQPNYDINTLAPFVALEWSMEGARPRFARRALPPYTRSWELVVAAAGGLTNVAFATGEEAPGEPLPKKDYGIANLTATVYRQTSWMSKLGGGMDLTYDGAAGADYDEETGEIDDGNASSLDKVSLGLYVGYEHVFHRTSALIQVGTVLLRSPADLGSEDFYQRLGIKVHVLDNTFVGLSARFTRFSRSEYLEWTLGQRWRW